MINKLTSISQHSIIAADTEDIGAIKFYKPYDVTTNPSLILNAVKKSEYKKLVKDAIQWAKNQSSNKIQQTADTADRLMVNIGLEILEFIPGRISTEIDARLSYKTEDSIEKAKRIMRIYNDLGVKNDRVLIKIASTWQGICAAEQLEKNGINCNLTLLFSLTQARACAEAGVHLISPFVGRILDWHLSNTDTKNYAVSEDPGVRFVTEVFKYYKQHGYKTIIMGASFRNTSEIIELAGCDRLTISPTFLKKLSEIEGTVDRKLTYTGKLKDRPKRITESEFFYQHNRNIMAVDRLTDGIRKFSIDQEKLEKFIENLL